MAQAGFTPIKLYLSTTAAAVPLAADLAPGELAINNNDGKLFYEDSSGVVQVIATKAGASGDVVGPASATANAIPSFNGTTGKLIQNNSGVTIAANVVTATGFTGALNGTLGATTPATVVATQVDITAQGDLRLQDTTGGEYVALQAPGTIAASYTLTLPVDDGTAGQALITDGSGVLSWSTAASGDVYGPASATDNAVARFDGTTGKLIQNSAVTIADTTGDISGVGQLNATTVDATNLEVTNIKAKDGTAALSIADSTGIVTGTTPQIISVNSSSDALRITQVGAGNALVVEDSANPDASPFLVAADGSVRVGSSTSYNTVYGASQFAPGLQSYTTAGTGGFYRYSADQDGAALIFSKSRSATLGTQTVASSGDTLGYIGFAGSDGTNFTTAANILAQVDGTPGTGDMPGRLTFNTTADGASSPTERMRIDSAGNISQGSSGTSLNYSFLQSKNVTGATTVIGFGAQGTVQSDVTSTHSAFRSNATTAAAAFTLATLNHFEAGQPAFGAGSTVTNQFGFTAGSTLTGATNNYGFFGNIASGTGRFNFYANGTAANVFVGTTSIGGTVGTESLRVSPVVSAVNYLQVAGGATTAGVNFSAQGSDANIFITYDTKGTEAHSFRTNGGAQQQFRIAHTPSAVNFLQMSGNVTGQGPVLSSQGSDTNVNMLYLAKGTGKHGFGTGGGAYTEQFAVTHTASAVNFLQVTGAATGVSPVISAAGSDANVGMILTSKGTFGLGFYTNAGAQQQFSVAHTASAVNYLQVTGGATGNSVKLSAQGSDANIDILITAKGVNSTVFSNSGGSQFAVGYAASTVNLAKVRGGATGAPAVYGVAGSDTNIDLLLEPQGTGNVRFGTYTAGVIAQAGYITIKDAGGTTRRLLVG